MAEPTITCKCGTVSIPVEGGNHHCPKCGAGLRIAQCPDCGAQKPWYNPVGQLVDSRWTCSCGKSLTLTVPAAVAIPSPAPVAPAPEPPTSTETLVAMMRGPTRGCCVCHQGSSEGKGIDFVAGGSEVVSETHSQGGHTVTTSKTRSLVSVPLPFSMWFCSRCLMAKTTRGLLKNMIPIAIGVYFALEAFFGDAQYREGDYICAGGFLFFGLLFAAKNIRRRSYIKNGHMEKLSEKHVARWFKGTVAKTATSLERGKWWTKTDFDKQKAAREGASADVQPTRGRAVAKKKLECNKCGGRMRIDPGGVIVVGGSGPPPNVKLRCDKCDITRFERRSEIDRELAAERRHEPHVESKQAGSTVKGKTRARKTNAVVGYRCQPTLKVAMQMKFPGMTAGELEALTHLVTEDVGSATEWIRGHLADRLVPTFIERVRGFDPVAAKYLDGAGSPE